MVFIVMAVLLVLAALTSAGSRPSRRDAANLSRRFLSLGNMYGKSRQQIVDTVGEPTTVSYLGRAQLLQWQVPGYHIALRIDDHDMFAGITHEYAAR